MRMSSGLGYDSTVMLTCKLLHKLCLVNLFFLQDQGGEVCIRLSPPDLCLGVGGSSKPPEPPQPTGLELWDGSVTLALEVMEVGQGPGIMLATLHHEYNSSLLIGLLELSPFEVSGYIIDDIISQVVCLL